MHWLALQWPPDAKGVASMPVHAAGDAPSRELLAWWVLGFTPHVVWLDEALLLEVSACERLWGGRRALIQRVLQSNPIEAGVECARAATSLVALARLRCQPLSGASVLDAMKEKTQFPARATRPVDLPLHTLTAARPHLGVLTRLGCRTWGDLAALPRAGLARRFGPELSRALDVAFGCAPDVHAWIAPPDGFEQALELPERADSAPALLWSARRLLTALQHWLAARQQGVLALELAWTFDQRRIDGRALPPEDAIVLRTAEGVQTMVHIQRLFAERLARTSLLAPARAIRLRVLQTAPWNPTTASFLPEDQPRGDPLHVFVERVSARLGTDRVRVPVPCDDHRPECRQSWQPAEKVLLQEGEKKALAQRGKKSNPRIKQALSETAVKNAPSPGGVGLGWGRTQSQKTNIASKAVNPSPQSSSQRSEGATPLHTGLADALSPTWLLREPQPLAVEAGQPCHQGRRLRLIAGPHRLEAGWWSTALPQTSDEAAAARDYFMAQSSTAELLWVYRERPMAAPSSRGPSQERWFLQGLYA